MRSARTDANQPDIVEALRARRATVHSLAAVGDGMPDLLVGYRGLTILMECKDGDKSPSRRRLTQDQVVWHAEWMGGQVYVVESVEDALRVLDGTRK